MWKRLQRSNLRLLWKKHGFRIRIELHAILNWKNENIWAIIFFKGLEFKIKPWTFKPITRIKRRNWYNL